jgi:iduronate 2-sulfatase
MEKLSPRSFWLAALLAALPASAPSSPRRPDIVLLCVDGLGLAPTPAMEALSRHARVFERAYLSHPAATVGRAALYLGRRPENTRIWGEAEQRPADVVALPEAFARGGYATVRIGRALGGPLEAQVKWDRTLVPSANEDTAAHVAAVLSTPHDRPLFLSAGFDDLGPVVAAAEAVGSRGGAVHPAIAFADLPYGGRPGKRATLAPPGQPARTEARRIQAQRTQAFDAQLARIVAVLDGEHRWENTIVVLVGMQAPALGEQATGGRADVLFEESLRVPLVIATPDVTSPGVTAAFVDTADVYPTLLALASLPSVADSDGKSLLPLLRDPKTSGHEAVASVVRREAGHLGRSLRTARWRFTEWPDGSLELYDHDADPHEYTNLARRAEHAKTVAEMKTLLERTPSAPNKEPAPPPQHRPNVLLIVLDDAAMHMGTYGFPAKTPNIDRLARVGRRFDRAYATVAICSPSRTAILTGWQPERSDVWDNIHMPRRPGMIPLEEHFAAHGYFTAQIGKVWESRFAKSFPWDVSEYFPGLNAPAGPLTAAQRKAWRAELAEAPPGGRDPNDISTYWKKTDTSDEQEADGRRARRVVQLLEEPRDKPFFIALGFGKPHLRWSVPRRYFDLYDPAKIQLPPNPPNDGDDIPEIAIEPEISRPGRFYVGHEDNIPPEMQRQAVAAYYATISFVDAQLGVVLEALDRLHRWQDTIVVLTSDHGFHLGEHRGDMWRKDTLFEEGVHVPLIVAAPGLADVGAPAAAPVELLDLYPTLVELAGLPVVGDIDGQSLLPMLRDPKTEVRTFAESWRRVQTPTVAVSVRSGRWRYTQWPDGSEELFDLDKDPQEHDNLVGRAEGPLAELRARRAELVP